MELPSARRCFGDVRSISLDQWTKHEISAECGKAYRDYERRLKEHYGRYFSENPNLRCPRHAYSARSIVAALPPGAGKLLRLMPPGAVHIHARSAKSSQALALSLLGSACQNDPSMQWLWRALDLPGRPILPFPEFSFEWSLSPDDLGESPHTTQLDFAVSDSSTFIAVESKWTEQGFDTCSCLRNREGSHISGGHCAERVLSRTRYWEVARDFLHLPDERLPLFPCQIAPLYQVIRNIAAASHLAGPKRRFGFVLLHDANNPFFKETNRWPGWPEMLRRSLAPAADSKFFFRAISWQELVPQLPVDDLTREWAREKHGLG